MSYSSFSWQNLDLFCYIQFWSITDCFPLWCTWRHIHAGLQIFFKIGGPKWPMEQKMVGHFLKWWAQAYQTNHRWHLGCYFTYTLTQTLVCIYVYWLLIILKRPLKKEDQLSLNAGQMYCRMLQGEHSAILSTFIKLPFVIKIFVLSFLSGFLRHVLLYWLPTWTFCFKEFVDSQ